ncbi:cell division protein FtsZ [Magnetospira sp. QH-2]|uniref:cell division protein FtsZ n=1 Tax=Magnetospira sp. (strain QH-2) TaxID=1288970 RepID=UPI0003E8173B|nr:cell division protein FtsZ [Magnetospira sp. QH-2]CCQ72798.1 cell division protein FtsZ, GTP binding domain [Magnetospira sp. QH-2]
MTINLSVPEDTGAPDLKPRITVIGVGGAGGNAVNNMIQSHLEGVDFVVANTDAQALAHARTDRRIQLGLEVTKGLGAGSRPEIGRQAAEESMDDILEHIKEANMVFITAGMGGGTGTGAAPIIAKAARDQGILTVGVVTKPFSFEGRNRLRLAEMGIEELQEQVDTLIIIPNQNLFRIANEKTTFADAFKMADDVLHQGVRGVTDLMVMPGLINLDFADIQSVMSEMGKAMMGTGEAEGERRAVEAAEAAISNPLLEDASISGAQGVLISITGGMDMTLFEVDEAANLIRDQVDQDANIIFGSTFDEKLEGQLRVSVVATGIDAEAVTRTRPAMTTTPSGGTPRPAPTNAEDGETDIRIQVETEAPEPTVTKAAEIAAQVEQAQLQPAPEKVTFIPPQPAQAKTAAPEGAADPFAEAAMANRPKTAAQRAETKRAPKPAEAPRSPSLFERVTGTGWAKSDSQKVATPKPSIFSRNSAPAPQAVEQKAVSPAQAGEGLNPGDRLPNSAPEEDLLDIPAFLRRQSN